MLEGWCEDQSTYQAKQIESKEPTDSETNKLEQKPSPSITCRNCGCNYSHMEHAQRKAKLVITVENLIILPMFVEENKIKNKSGQ